MNTNRRIVLIVLLPILILLVACAPGAVEPGIAPEIFITPGPTETILLSNEEIMQDNCNGGAMMSQTVERSYTVSRIVELGAAITVDAGGRAGIPGVGEVGVGAAVASHYNVSYGSEERVARQVMVATEKGQHILHTIRQYELWETGTLTIAGATDPIPYRFRKDFSMETLPPANLGCPGQGAQPPQPTTEPDSGPAEPQPQPSPFQPETVPDVEPPPSSIQTHTSLSAGDGIFANVTVSDGQASISISEINTNHQSIQRIRREEQPSGCDQARYASDKVWVTGTPGMRLTLNGLELGTYQIAPDAHGYMLDLNVAVGDQICAVDFGPEGFSIIFGPDVYYHYDSYCHRFGC